MEAHNPKPASILLVDDLPENLLALETVLTTLGQRMVKARSGADALRALLQEDFAVILLDVQMPVMDGFQTAALIRERDRSKHTPIIFLTAIGKTEEDIFKGYSTGAVDYIFKPFNPDILTAKVRVFVDLYQLREQIERQAAQLQVANARLEAEIAKRQRAQALVEAANKELEAFAYSVSHDLRAPLNHIEYFAQALVQDAGAELGAKAQKDLTQIQAATTRMGDLMADLLKLSRVTRAEMRRAPVDLSALARQIISDLRQRDPARQVECVIADGLSAHGDAGLLQVALENLLGNAWKYSGKRADARIEFGRLTPLPSSPDGNRQERREGPGVGGEVFLVRDNGAGFRMEHAAKLFSPFQRLHSPSEFEGTGIGLSIVQRIIHRHNGRIWAEAEPAKGATFFFTLGE